MISHFWMTKIKVYSIVFAFSLLHGCSMFVPKEEIANAPLTLQKSPKEIFVFLDGTRNDPTSDTNVWRMYQAAKASNRHAIYIAGVGTGAAPLLGSLLGFGMEPRILRAYAYLSRDFSPRDKIYIFGFSRGAHQARALAGLISYAGLMPAESSADTSTALITANRILEFTKEFSDNQVFDKMRINPNEPPLLRQLNEEKRIVTIPANIEFLGVWDTVPGSFFKQYQGCRELNREPDGERYKTGSYPAIKHIAHALALDEKRSKFLPITLCDAVDPSRTITDELWFAGSHSDVGGGYQNSSMHISSLNWMISKLNSHLREPFTTFPGDGLEKPAHWAIGDRPGNWFSDCVDRVQGSLHESAIAFRQRSTALLVVKGKVIMSPNPPTCDSVPTR